MDLKTYVYNERTKRHMSQRDLSELSGICPAEISRIESGQRTNPSVKVLHGLAIAFGVAETTIIEALRGELKPTTEEVSAAEMCAWLSAIVPEEKKAGKYWNAINRAIVQIKS